MNNLPLDLQIFTFPTTLWNGWGAMVTSEKNREVFIIRIWRELREHEGASTEWRGVIESVHGGEQRYLKNLDEIIAFIEPYLAAMDVRIDTPSRVKRWLTRLK